MHEGLAYIFTSSFLHHFLRKNQTKQKRRKKITHPKAGRNRLQGKALKIVCGESQPWNHENLYQFCIVIISGVPIPFQVNQD